MSDLLDKKLSVAVAVSIAVYWGLAFLIPFLITDRSIRPDAWAVGLIALFLGYLAYTGYRAWRQGWKARFVLRIVVPLALFVASWMVIGLASWLG